MNSKIDSKTSITFTYPQDKSESSDSAKITSFTATLKKGSTLQLGTILSGEGTVKWSTSKKSVATVTSKGKITAKAKGTAVITAKTGDSSMKITIKVTE
ncbi:MAG: Ig-like domain-containing protein [Oscillospiraceae bacterium]|nr:Ig-like domain-containing protein [Oscillospiraceae bacterium]